VRMRRSRGGLFASLAQDSGCAFYVEPDHSSLIWGAAGIHYARMRAWKPVSAENNGKAYQGRYQMENGVIIVQLAGWSVAKKLAASSPDLDSIAQRMLVELVKRHQGEE
jgi:hypothetical protein